MNGLFLILALPGLLLGLWAQFKLRGTFGRYVQVPTASGVNGVQTAETLMRAAGLNIGVRGTSGMLTDFYDPRTKSINLAQSSEYDSIASVAVVAHEMGHAVQDAQGYLPMRLRGAIVPAVSLGAWVGPLMFIGGLYLNSQSLAVVGLVLFSAVAIFSLVTLPVEFDASRRGLEMLQSTHILQPQEVPAARKVLTAAALTYVAAALQS
ncbi:MAG: zinc metallopeptidase, partial [Candidatus Eremiobacteraeota bacterium]|nr:zinc metallopeptidase [Candidatus Eremiobacteraeota bacterium]